MYHFKVDISLKYLWFPNWTCYCDEVFTDQERKLFLIFTKYQLWTVAYPFNRNCSVCFENGQSQVWHLTKVAEGTISSRSISQTFMSHLWSCNQRCGLNAHCQGPTVLAPGKAWSEQNILNYEVVMCFHRFLIFFLEVFTCDTNYFKFNIYAMILSIYTPK